MYKFNGKELDESTGYYYYGARYYDPAISIFLSVDPLAEQFPAWNPYHYVHNNPINLIDPTGMSAKQPGEGDPVKQPSQLGNIVKDALTEMGTMLDDIVINVQRGADKLSSDWESNKEKSGYNHFKNHGQNNRFGFMKIYGNGNENGGFSNRGIGNNLSVDANDVGMLINVGGAGLAGANSFFKAAHFLQTAIGGFSGGVSLGGKIEEWLGLDKVTKHTFDGFKVVNPNSPYSYGSNKAFYIEPVQRDTFLIESKIKNTNWNNFKSLDSINKSKEAKMWNNKYKL